MEQKSYSDDGSVLGKRKNTKLSFKKRKSGFPAYPVQPLDMEKVIKRQMKKNTVEERNLVAIKEIIRQELRIADKTYSPYFDNFYSIAEKTFKSIKKDFIRDCLKLHDDVMAKIGKARVIENPINVELARSIEIQKAEVKRLQQELKETLAACKEIEEKKKNQSATTLKKKKTLTEQEIREAREDVEMFILPDACNQLQALKAENQCYLEREKKLKREIAEIIASRNAHYFGRKLNMNEILDRMMKL